MKRLFVTGGAGYVGSHCCKAFAEAGWDIVVFDDLSRGWRDFVLWGELIEGDLRDAGGLLRAVARTQPDAVAHFAALADVAESILHPDLYYRVNVCGTLNLLDAMRATGVNKIIFSSTCATYGAPEIVPITETNRQAPINPYGRSKLFAERMLADHAEAFGLRYAALRYFNAAGADPDARIGERRDRETHVIPLAIRDALAGDNAFTIHGGDFDTRDGTAVRDYVHVADLADGHVLALKHLMDGGGADVFNLGAGVGTTVAEIMAAVERVAGRNLRRHVGPRRVGDPPTLVASTDKARTVLGWSPTRSNIETIVATAWRWHARSG